MQLSVGVIPHSWADAKTGPSVMLRCADSKVNLGPESALVCSIQAHFGPQ